MILHQQPKTFVIALKDHEISLKQLEDCKASANMHGWKIETFWGVNGRSITEENWKSIGVTPITKKLGQQGCWFSHYLLWNKCIEINEPIVIFEHDAVIQQPWMPLEIDISIVKLHKHYRKYPMDSKWIHPIFGRWSPSMHAYVILPKHADILLRASKKFGCYNADVFTGDKVISVELLGEPELVMRQNTFSTTGTI
jgi:hypothetical protein